MRRLVLLTVVAISALGVAGTTAVAQDVSKPLCADIFNGDFFYNTGGFVVFNFDTHEPSCKGVTYTLVVEVDPGTTVSTSVRGTDATHTRIDSPTFTDADGQVCAYATSSKGGKEGQNQIIDRAPDAGCVTMIPGGSGGAPSHG